VAQIGVIGGDADRQADEEVDGQLLAALARSRRAIPSLRVRSDGVDGRASSAVSQRWSPAGFDDRGRVAAEPALA
jgi:hypothetical protein